MKKISAIFWTLLFIIFAVYQTNDPDPIVWILIYGAAALLSLLVILDKSSRPVLLIALIAFLAGAAMHWPDTFEGILLKEDGSFTPAIEEARESLGLLIAGLAMGWHLFVTRAKQTVNS
jgi:hypothetical protein